MVNKKIFIFAAVTVLMIFLCRNVKLSSADYRNEEIFTIEFNHYGMNCSKIESEITEPLEKVLQELPGLNSIQSRIEYSKSFTTLTFSNSKVNNYSLISELVYKFHSTLPEDVSKPVIYSSSQDESPLFRIAVIADKNQNIYEYLNSEIKPLLQKINEISLVKILGQGDTEFIINFENDLTCLKQINPNKIADSVNKSTAPDILINDCIIKSKPENFSLLKKIFITPGIALEDISEIEEKEKMINSITRLNGKNCLIMTIYCETNSNKIICAKKIRKILKKSDFNKLQSFILLDQGKEIQKSIIKILCSFFESIIFISILIPCFFKSKKLAISVIFTLVVSCIWSLGTFELFGIQLNQKSILGLTLSLGLISDTCLLIIENFTSSPNPSVFKLKNKKDLPAIIISLLTSIICLCPLIFFNKLIPGSKDLALTIIIMLSTSTVISMIFLPDFLIFLKPLNKISSSITFPDFKFLPRFINNRKLFFILQPVSILLIFIIPKSLTDQRKQNYVFCQVEFESNRKASSVEKDIKNFCDKILESQKVKFIQTECSTGQSLIYIIPKKQKNIKNIKEQIQINKDLIVNGTVFTEGLSEQLQKKNTSFKIGITGLSHKKCNSLIAEKCRILDNKNCRTVLNFKDGGSQLVFTPDRDLAIRNQFTSQQIASTASWILFGPVAAKFIEDGKEKDIRIKAKNNNDITLQNLKEYYVPAGDSQIPIFELGKISKEENQLALLRYNCKPVSYMTVTKTGTNIIQNINEVKKQLKNSTLPEGYNYLFPEELKESCRQFLMLYATLFLSIIFIFILTATLTEKILNSLIAASIIFPSIFLPVFLRFIFNSGIEFGDFIGLILLSGITVNNSIFILSSNNYCEKFKSITTSALTTLASSLPLMFITGDVFTNRFSFTMFFGILGSWYVSLYLFPKAIKKTAQN